MKLLEGRIIDSLIKVVGRDWVITEREFMEGYLKDETPEPLQPSPASDLILVKPSSTKEVSKVLELANEELVSVFPVGGRTGLVGGSVPTEPGIILSLERMGKIEIDRENLMAIVEAGATLGDLIKASSDSGLFFPLHPGDEGAQIGGLIATNAGGVRAVKYGVMRNYVKGIEAVLPTGEVLNLGGRLIKNNTGYDLMHLVIGSEGTLCVIAKAVIKLYPRSMFTATLVAPFDQRSDAIRSVQGILRSGVIPLAIEYIEIEEINAAAEHLNEEWSVQTGKAQLIVILTGESEDELFSACGKISQVSEGYGGREIMIAETREEQDRILRVRSNIYTTLKPKMVDILDVTVPPSRLGELMNAVDEMARNLGVHFPVYGHAGDGNLHVHIMKENGKEPDYVEKVKRDIYEAGISLGGVITGEHGIGKIRTKEMSLVLGAEELNLGKGIKRLFDPNNILNPGKVFPLS
jgi:glycolate oxidase